MSISRRRGPGRISIRRGVIALCAALIGAPACDPGTGPDGVGVAATLEILPPVDTVNAAGDSVRFAARVTDGGGNVLAVAGDVLWSSPDSAHVSFGEFGWVRAQPSPTPLTIIARYESLADTARLVARQVPAAVVLDTAELVLLERADAMLHATVYDSANAPIEGARVEWESTDPTVATADSAGRVAGVSAGDAWVRAVARGPDGSGDGEAGTADSAAVTVVRPEPPATLHVSPAADTVNASGDSIRFTARVLDGRGRPVAGATERVRWSSIEVGRVWVKDGGLIVFFPRDDPTGIVGTLGELADTAWVLARQVPARIALDTAALALPEGSGATLRPEVYDSGGTPIRPPPVAWRSTDPAVAAVDGAGNVTATGVGEAWVVAELAGDPGSDSPDVDPDSAAVTVVPAETTAFATVDAGYVGHACALSVDGRAYCWGLNTYAELGIGESGAPRTRPTPVATSLRFVEVIAGNRHSCARTGEGEVWCWGESVFTAGSTPETCHGLPCTTQPQPVRGIPPIASLHGTRGTCALAADGRAYCFENGPRRVFDGLDVVDLATTEWSYCALTRAGEVLCHDRRESGPPELQASDSTFVSLTGGYGHACALTAGGETICWGANATGQLGRGQASEREDEAAAVRDGPSFDAIEAGGWVVDYTDLYLSFGTTCGVAVDGTAYCWGANGYGQLGSGDPRPCESERLGSPITLACEPAPVRVAGVASFQQISAGGRFACGLGTDGILYCWGSNENGALGLGAEHLAPVQCSDRHTCAYTPVRVFGQPE